MTKISEAILFLESLPSIDIAYQQTSLISWHQTFSADKVEWQSRDQRGALMARQGCPQTKPLYRLTQSDMLQ
jgi:hypothetical protein